MPDRKKVINALGRCKSYGYCEDKLCPYYGDTGCFESMRKDTLELLKKHEALKPIKPIYQGDDSYLCDNCGEIVGWEEMAFKYCPGCGKKVKIAWMPMPKPYKPSKED